MAELIISIAILLLMLSLAGQVFNLTIQSTGQATALTRINQDLRALEQALREDLRYVQPGQSLLLIQGNPVNAYWSESGREADGATATTGNANDGYPHAPDPEREDAKDNLLPPRADILMFFTARRGTSFINRAITSNVQQVVYAHADFIDYVPAPNPAGATCDDRFQPASGLDAFPVNGDYPDPDKLSAVPAEQWHLARRSILLLQNSVPDDPPRGVHPSLDASTATGALDNKDLLRSKFDSLWNFNYEEQVLRGGYRSALSAVDEDSKPWFLPNIFAAGNQIRDPYRRSQLDPTPPTICSERMGHYFQPGCASFKVEWCLNPASEFVGGRLDGIDEVFWFDPGDLEGSGATKASLPLRSLRDRVEELELKSKNDPVSQSKYRKLRSLLCDPVDHADGMRYSLADRFDPETAKNYCRSRPDEIWDTLSGQATRSNLIVFNGQRPVIDPATGNVIVPNRFVPDSIFPGALRITVDLMDQERRLDRPVRHVMVIPVGE